MRFFTSREAWLKATEIYRPQFITVLMTRINGILFSNQWYECGQYPDY